MEQLIQVVVHRLMEWLRPKIFGSDHVLSVSNLLVTSRNLSVASHKSKSQRFAGSRQHDLNEVTAEQRPCKLLAVAPNHRFDSNARAAPTTHCDAGNTVFNHIFLRPMISVPKCSQMLWMNRWGNCRPPAPSHARRAQDTFGGWFPSCLFYVLLRTRFPPLLLRTRFASPDSAIVVHFSK